LEIRQVRYTHLDVHRLVEEVQAEYTSLYGAPDDTPLDPTMFDAPSGAFFLGYLAGSPVAMGGWRFRPDVVAFGRYTAAEIKRMYVGPAARRTGLARVMLDHLERNALAAGADLMVLETGTEQPAAIALYTSSGYTRVEGFGHYTWSPKARCYGRPLTAD
jgi:GNAT superfamily N-acetyltransferase